MASKVSTSLELPPIPGISLDLEQALNDRMREIGRHLDSRSSGIATVAASGTATASGGELILSVPGVLGVRTDAAPRVSLQSTLTPNELLVLVKRAPVDADILVVLQVAGVDYASVTIVKATTSGRISSLAGIAKDALITLDIRQVGTKFPGADLSALLRF